MNHRASALAGEELLFELLVVPNVAIADYDTSIEMCPWAVDPVLNRGVALEAIGKYDEVFAFAFPSRFESES